MKLKCSLLTAALFTCSLHASDPLWTASSLGSAIGPETSHSHWTLNSHPLEIVQDDEGLRFISPENAEEVSSASRYVKTAPGYGYLTMQTTYEGVGSYKSYYIGLIAGDEATVIGMGGAPLGGIITLPVSESLLSKGVATIRVDAINGTINFSRLALESEPVPRLEFRTGGEKDSPVPLGKAMEVFVELEKRAEGVTISFIRGRDMRPFKINGVESMELVPVNAEATQWKGEIIVRETNISDLPEGNTAMLPGSFILRADVLIGDLSEPIWTANQSPINVQ